jgi:transketolase
MNVNASIDTLAMATAVRFLAADMVDAARSGHPGLPLGMADVATVLWTNAMRFVADDPGWPDRDRFVLSAGHGSALLYALAWLNGTAGVELDHLRAFRQLGSPAAGHPERGHFPGVETTTGPLGQGLATAVGMAIAEERLRAEFGPELCDHRTWVIAGDGCLMEGISQEAISLAGHLQLGRLTVLWDDNRITIDGPTSLSNRDDQLLRFAASGWRVMHVDGHDHPAIVDAIDQARLGGCPTLLACRTTIGHGAPNRAGTHDVHGTPLGTEERAAMAVALDWPHAPFVMPDAVLAAWRANGSRCGEERDGWVHALHASGDRGEALRDRLRPQLAMAADRALDDLLEQAASQPSGEASRVSSQRVITALAPATPALFGGSADLGVSNGTRVASHRAFTAADRGGDYLHYGVREHAMAAAMNGIAAHGGFVAYGGTFLAFSDYARPAIRLAAMMGLPVVHVLTHDSIGVGEDGPTHQPIEHVCSLRAIPNLLVIRPADAVETIEAWRIALDQQDRPTALILTRQSLAPIDRSASTAGAERGGYTLTYDGVEPDVVLMASGSEVELAVAARALLAADGVAARVVSMPCLELFAAQPESYRQAVLGNAPRVAIEASIGQSWHALLGRTDVFVGMAGFGASGPGPALFEHFGITAAAVRDAADRVIRPRNHSPHTKGTA